MMRPCPLSVLLAVCATLTLGACPAAEGEGEGEGEGELLSLDEALALLRADPDAALLALSKSHGLPLVLDDGRRLFVSTFASERQLAGELNGWVPEPMTDEGDFAWLARSAADGGGYKLTNGTSWLADPRSRAYGFDGYGEMSLVSRVGQGRERHFDVGGFGLGPRVVRALVPAGSVTHVLYAHDGQNLFHPDDQTMFGSWHIEASVPPGVLVIGIDNTAARMDEYTHVADDIPEHVGGSADDYARLVEETVRPLVRRWYGEPGPVGVMGSSLGGLVSLAIADRNPAGWDFVASLSGTLGWGSIAAGSNDGDDTIIDLWRGAGRRPFTVYLDSGGTATPCADDDGDGIRDDGSGGDNSCETEQMYQLMLDEGQVEGVDLFYVLDEGAGHNEAAWAARVGDIMELFAQQ